MYLDGVRIGVAMTQGLKDRTDMYWAVAMRGGTGDSVRIVSKPVPAMTAEDREVERLEVLDLNARLYSSHYDRSWWKWPFQDTGHFNSWLSESSIWRVHRQSI